MPEYKRFGNRWTIKECLQLQREFELLQLSIGEIAKRHKRTPNAIMLKLDQEGLADYNAVHFNYTNSNSTKTARKIERTYKYDYLCAFRQPSSDEVRNYAYNTYEYDEYETETENDVESEVETESENESVCEPESEVASETDSDESSAKEEIQVKATKSNSMKKLKQQVMKIEEQLSQLNKFLLNQTKEKKQSKTVFSLFG
jgi:hypothetical protein